ncbi:MAG TPA: zinc-binding dehydrogenase [Longimicrobiales bacterium]
MTAAVIRGPRDLRIEQLPEPVAGPGEIVIRTLAASICNATDVHIWEGSLGEELRPPYPHVLGHERVGVVVALGADVTGFAVGDRVSCWAKMDGAFGEYDVLRPSQYPTVRLSDGVSSDAGSLLELVGATLRCMHASGLRPGERVLILGQGVQGLVLAREAKLLGAGLVATVDLLASRLDRSRAMGSDVAYDLSGKRYDEALAELRDAVGGEVDLVIDASGRGTWEGGNSVNLALELLRWAGRYVVYGLPTHDVSVNARMVGVKGITFKGIDTPPHEVRALLALGERWVAEGRLALEGLVTHRVPLERVAEGLALCRDRPAEVLKVMVEFEG